MNYNNITKSILSKNWYCVPIATLKLKIDAFILIQKVRLKIQTNTKRNKCI